MDFALIGTLDFVMACSSHAWHFDNKDESL